MKTKVTPQRFDQGEEVVVLVRQKQKAVKGSGRDDSERHGSSSAETMKPGRRKNLKKTRTPKPPGQQENESAAWRGDRSRRGSGNLNAFDQYMNEVGQVALLTPQEEIELAARIRQGDEGAREHMIRANLRFVVKLARDYEGLGLPLLDLINEGNIGLIKAVEKFDPAKGGKLTTYSSWWIKQSMRRALANQSRTIRLPVNAVDQIYHMHKATNSFQTTHDREPTDGELADLLGLNLGRIAELRRAQVRTTSLDTPTNDDQTGTIGEMVPDESATDPSTRSEESNDLSRLSSLMETLDTRETIILRERFGLNGAQEKTLEEIGQQFGLTRERIRQLQNSALHKLRKMLESQSRLPTAA